MMPTPKNIDIEWFDAKRKAAGYRSNSAFALEIGLTDAQWSLIKAARRRVQPEEIALIAKALGESMADVARALDVQYADPLLENVLKITASVGDEGIVSIYDERAEDFGVDEIEVPFITYEGAAIAIKTDTLAPRYLRGEVIAARIYPDGDHRPDIDEFVGWDVIAWQPERPPMLKSLQPGSQQGRHTLVSLCAGVAPVQDALIERIVPVDFHIPLGRKPSRFR